MLNRMDAPPDDPVQILWGAQEARIRARLEALDPTLARWVLDFTYGEVYARGGLDLKTRELLACAMLVAQGNPPELTTHLRGALRAGASEQEVREALLLAVPYLGFPRVLGAFEQLAKLLHKKPPAP